MPPAVVLTCAVQSDMLGRAPFSNSLVTVGKGGGVGGVMGCAEAETEMKREKSWVGGCMYHQVKALFLWYMFIFSSGYRLVFREQFVVQLCAPTSNSDFRISIQEL